MNAANQVTLYIYMTVKSSVEFTVGNFGWIEALHHQEFNIFYLSAHAINGLCTVDIVQNAA